ncbi:MAG: ABC transporter substrate-binding protein [Betaproteobacteria bacterium]|nr:ABC transporter substrate-binding protein [Betaproteobacteria bacterium]
MKLKALVLAAALAAAGPLAAQDLVLGLTHAKTGRYAGVAIGTEVAVDIAVAEINAAGGVNGKRLRVEKFDTGSDAKNAQVAAQKFAQDARALGIIGPFSSQEAQVAFAAGERLEIVQIPNAASAPGLTKDRNWAFRITEDEGKQFGRLLKTLETKGGFSSKTAAVMFPSDEFVGKALAGWMPSLLEKSGWKMVIPAEGFATNATDLSPHVTKLKGNTPAVVAFAGLPEGAIKVMKEVRRQGHNSTLIGSQIFADPDIAKVLGADGEGAIFVSWYWWDLNDRTRAFEKKFLEEAGKRGINKSGAHHVDASAYDIVYAYADAMRRAKVTGDAAKLKEERSAIREALRATDLDGVTGKVCFDRDRDSELSAYIIQIKGGKRTLLDTHAPDSCK